MRKPKRGRPPLPKAKIKAVFSLRFSADELSELKRAAKQSGEKLRTWARNRLLERAANGN